MSILPSNSNREFSPLFKDNMRSGHNQVAINRRKSNINMEFNNQLLETPNSAKSTNSDALKRELRKALKLEDYRTPSKVALFTSVPNIQSTNIDAL